MFVFGARRRERVLMELFLILIFWTEIRRWIRKREREEEERERSMMTGWLLVHHHRPFFILCLAECRLCT